MPLAPRISAVITGDIVRSGQLSGERFERVQATLRRGGDEIRDRFADCVPLPLELFRGDSWQLLVTVPASALRMALYLRAFLRAGADVDTRFAIGVGPIDAVPTDSIATGRGEAFRLSGEALDWKVSTRMRVAIAESHPDAERDARAIETVLTVLDVIVGRWTGAQGRAICGALLDLTQEKIAADWPDEPITQQAVAQHLSRGGWDGVREALRFYEELMEGENA